MALHTLLGWSGALTMAVSSLWATAQAGQLGEGYRYRGAVAPQVQPNPRAQELEQRLQQLKQSLEQRSLRTSLESAVEQSLLHNPDLATAFAQIQQNEWSLIAIRRQWYPSVGLASTGPAGGLWGYGSSQTWRKVNSPGATSTTRSFEERSVVSPSLGLSWTFFDPSRGDQINAASESLRSQQLLFNVSARNLVLQTQLAYFGLQEQLELVNSYQQILDATTDQVKQSEALFNTGNASIADVEQIRTQQYQTLSLIIATYLRVIDSAALLAKSMALPAGQLALPNDKLSEYGEWRMSLTNTIEQAQALREEIQASLAQASGARWSASALFNRYWPRLSLLANGAYTGLDGRSGLLDATRADTLQSASWSGAVGVAFNWNFFDGGIAAAEAEAAQARARQLKDQANSQRLAVTEEVERSYGSFLTSRLGLISSSEQASSARKAAVAIRERFNVGYADTTSVVQTLNQAISAANAYALSQREYNSAIARLYRASAQWPGQTEAQRDQRVQLLRQRQDKD